MGEQGGGIGAGDGDVAGIELQQLLVQGQGPGGLVPLQLQPGEIQRVVQTIRVLLPQAGQFPSCTLVVARAPQCQCIAEALRLA